NRPCDLVRPEQPFPLEALGHEPQISLFKRMEHLVLFGRQSEIRGYTQRTLGTKSDHRTTS
ncbi:MAG: hypothetical protein ACRDHY_01300, partial [Anaerolineales bacterium]